MLNSLLIRYSIILVLVLFTMTAMTYGQGTENRPTISKDIGVGPGLEVGTTPEILKHVGVEQNIGASLPLDLEFYDETGAVVTLGSFLGDKPVILSLVY